MRYGTVQSYFPNVQEAKCHGELENGVTSNDTYGLVQNFDSGLLVEQKNDSLIQSTLNLVSMSQFYHQICQSERRKSLCTGQKSMRTTGFTIIR